MRGKNPTRLQKRIMLGENLNPMEWLVLKNPTNELVIQSRGTKEIRKIVKQVG